MTRRDFTRTRKRTKRKGTPRKNSRDQTSPFLGSPHTISASNREKDILLLKECGFKGKAAVSFSTIVRKINGLNMRQLDRLKLLLCRNEGLCNGGYSEDIKHGITKNDFAAFAKALICISPEIFA